MSSEQLDLFPTEESSQQVGPVRTSPWRGVVRAWLEHGQGCGGTSPASWLNFAPHGSSGRTSLASCHRCASAPAMEPVLPMDVESTVTESPTTSSPPDAVPVAAWKPTVGPWVPSSGRWQNSGMGSPTEFWTLSTSEFPSSVVESSLSDILEPPSERLRKYYLSPKAAAGILRRAGRRGRKLPVALRAALERLAAT